MNIMNNTSTADNDAEAQEADRLQGERFLQLSQRCHEQNWAQVHALAEQIVLHKRTRRPSSEDKAEGNGSANKANDGGRNGDEDGRVLNGGGENRRQSQSGANNTDDVPNSDRSGRASREGSVSISGEVMMHIIDSNVDGGSSDTTTNIEQEINYGGMLTLSNDGSSNGVDVNTSMNLNDTDGNAPTQVVRAPPPPAPAPIVPPPSTPRMLSTCLGTASPLAWTCRYSAPSSTVKLVLDLDLSAVRRCLPQLGTPLHECVGRPRPLRKMPMKRGRWSSMIGNYLSSSGGAQATNISPATAASASATTTTDPKPRKKGKKKKKKNKRTPPILSGLREWRRTVRTLIQADETLLKEDAKFAALKKTSEADQNGDAAITAEEWRRTVHTMIKDNVTNIQKFKEATKHENGLEGSANNNDGREDGRQSSSTAGMQGAKRSSQSSLKPSSMANNNSIPTQGLHHSSIRATLAQDADGNTPLHFMLRGAAAPAFGGGEVAGSSRGGRRRV